MTSHSNLLRHHPCRPAQRFDFFKRIALVLVLAVTTWLDGSVRATPFCCRWETPPPPPACPKRLLIVVDQSSSTVNVSEWVTRRPEIESFRAEMTGRGVSVKLRIFPTDVSETVCRQPTLRTVAPFRWLREPADDDLRAPKVSRAFTHLDEALVEASKAIASDPELHVLFLTDGINVRGEPRHSTHAINPATLAKVDLALANFTFLHWLLGPGAPTFPRERDLFQLRPSLPSVRSLKEFPELVCGAAKGIGEGTESVTSDEVSQASAVAVGDEAGLFCSGVVVAERAVLTARHCLPATLVHKERNGGEAQERAVAYALPHPDPEVDAAILVLEDNIVAPVAMRRQASEVQAPVGRLRHVGFGVVARGVSFLGAGKHPVDVFASGWQCDRPTQAERYGCSSQWELAIPGSAGLDTCDGDSGGPLFERFVLTSSDPRAALGGRMKADAARCLEVCDWRAVGITSRPVANSARRCGGGGVYVRVDRLAPWIDEVVRKLASVDGEMR